MRMLFSFAVAYSTAVGGKDVGGVDAGVYTSDDPG